MPSNDTKTFQINSQGHVQCHQDLNLIHKPNNKGKLPGSREAPIYHEPGTVSCKTVEDLKKLYPNSFDSNSYVLTCDYFSKFPFLYRAKTSFWSLRNHLIDLFSIEGYPDEIVSDNGPPFQSKGFAKFLSGLGIKPTTSSPGYLCSNGFIEYHIQMVKNMLCESSNTRSFQEVLADLRMTRIGTGLPSPAEILHRRNLSTKVQAEININAIHSLLQERQLKMTLAHDSSKRAKKARPLVVGERCYVLGPKNIWIDTFVTGITDSGRSYEL